MNKFSIIILCKNEAKNLKELLPTLNFADEILLINDGSTDNTKQIAKEYQAKILDYSVNSDFAAARQYALTHIRCGWAMFVDADERLSPELIKWLKKRNFYENVGGYSFKRVDWFWGRSLNHGETGNCYLTRLVNKNHGRFVRPVHEIWVSNKQIVKVNQNYPLYHYPHQSINEFLKHVNFYSTINAKHWYQQKRSVTIWEIILVPWSKFGFTYFIKLGFLDGASGFVYSFMMSFHSFLSRAKLYQLNQND